MKGFKEGYAFFEGNVSPIYGTNSGIEYVQTVQSGIDKLTQELNSFKEFKTDASILKGNVAEFWHSGTHNIDAAVKGKNVSTKVDRSHDFASADITGENGELYGLKFYKTGTESAKAQSESLFHRYSEYKSGALRENRSYDSLEEYLEKRGYNDVEEILHDPIYSGQIRIIPKDQMEEAIAWLKRKIIEESVKRPEQIPRYQDTLNLLQDRISSTEGTESIALSKEDAETLALLAKEGKLNAKELGLTTEELINYKYVMEQAFKAGMTAATISVVIKMAPEIIRAINYLIKQGEIDEEQFKKIGFAAINGGAEGFIRGTVSAAITTACVSGLWGETLKLVNPYVIGAITVTVMNVMRNSFFVGTGKMQRNELIDALMRDMFLSSCSLILGGITQSVIHIPIFGFLIGSFVGSIVGSFAYSKLNKAYISFCVDSGFTMFGIVKQNYTLPSEVLKEIGIKVFEYDKFEYNRYEYKKFEYKRFEYKKFEYPTIGIKFLRRGVIGVNQIGYL